LTRDLDGPLGSASVGPARLIEPTELRAIDWEFTIN